MKILWVSNAPWTATGYGQQTAQVISRLRKHHDVAVAANYGLHGQRMDWEGVPVYPAGHEAWSNDVIPAHAKHFGADWVITLMDTWVFNAPGYQRLNVASWTPVDHVPCPPRVLNWFTKFGAVPISMSLFGQQMLEHEGLKPLHVPHAIDTQAFAPVPDAKRLTGLPGDRFVVGMVSANKGKAPSRKAFPEAFMAFSKFHKNHPDSLLYVHSEQTGTNEGLDLGYLAAACDIPEDALIFTEPYTYSQGVGQPMMTALYSAFDVLLCPSLGEGFGLPVIEAQACGTPVIVTDWTAQPELVGAGWPVPGQPSWDGMQDAWYCVPDVRGLVDALEAAYAADPVQLDVSARAKAVQYDADTIYRDFWTPTLANLEQRLPSIAPISCAS